VVATAIGSDIVLKAAAGVIAMLLAGGAAYKAGTVAKGATAAPPRTHTPTVHRVLLKKAESARPPRAERHARPGKATTPRRESIKAAVVRRHPAPLRHRVERSNGIAKRHVVAPVSTQPATPPTQRPRSSSPATSPAPPALPQVDVPAVQVPAVQLPKVSTPQLPPVTVPTPPPVPQLPDPPPLPKIP
jgi:hypothetical protein